MCIRDSLADDMELAEAMIKYVIKYVLENAPEEMNFFNSFVDKGLLDRLNPVSYTHLEQCYKWKDPFAVETAFSRNFQAVSRVALF